MKLAGWLVLSLVLTCAWQKIIEVSWNGSTWEVLWQCQEHPWEIWLDNRMYNKRCY